MKTIRIKITLISCNFVIYEKLIIPQSLRRIFSIRYLYRMSNLAHQVFVYGTLKKNEPNHNYLTNQQNGIAKFISKASTVEQYPLVVASKYNIPFLIDCAGKGFNVKGEVYEVDDKMLSALDDLEGCPTQYVREKRNVILEDKSKLQVWMYLLQTYRPSLLEETLLEDYHNGVNGKKYFELDLRDDSGSAYKEVQGS